MTREPIPIEIETTAETAEPTPPPVRSTSLRTPSAEFIERVCVAIRAGASPANAAEWCGVSRVTWKRWMASRDGGACDALRTAVRAAKAHLRVRLESEIAKEHPERALRRLDVRDEQAEDGRRYTSAARPYTKSGYTLVSKALPHLVERVTDAAIPATDLSPIEQAARAWRDDVISDLGGIKAIPTTKMALLNAAVGSMILMSSIDAYLFVMAQSDGLVSRKHRKAFPILEQRMRVADSLVRQLQALGLERVTTNAGSLAEYVAEKYGDKNDKNDVHVEQTKIAAVFDSTDSEPDHHEPDDHEPGEEALR